MKITITNDDGFSQDFVPAPVVVDEPVEPTVEEAPAETAPVEAEATEPVAEAPAEEATETSAE